MKKFAAYLGVRYATCLLLVASMTILGNAIACSRPPTMYHPSKSDSFLEACIKYDATHNWACRALSQAHIHSANIIMLPSNESIEPFLKRKNLSLRSSMWANGKYSCAGQYFIRGFVHKFAQAHYSSYINSITYKGKTLHPFTSDNLELTKAYNDLKKLSVTVYFIDKPFPF